MKNGKSHHRQVECSVCHRLLDARGIQGHMRTHESAEARKPMGHVLDPESYRMGVKDGIGIAKQIA